MEDINSQKKKSIYQIIKEDIIVPVLIASSLFAWYHTNERTKVEEREIVKVEYRDVNSDNVEDRIISYKMGKDQIQFGIKKTDNTIEYLTFNQIKDRETKRLEEVLSKYNIKN